MTVVHVIISEAVQNLCILKVEFETFNNSLLLQQISNGFQV